MSADNWATCPRCLDTERAKVTAARAALDEQYGKVTRLEYKSLEAARVTAEEALEKFQDYKARTFREDYEFYGADEGTVQARYSGGCNKCGLSVEFEHSKGFYTPGVPS